MKPKINIGRVRGGTLLPTYDTLTDEQMNHHVHVVGPTGYGKTTLLTHIFQHQVEAGKGLLFIDLKGDLETIESLSAITKAAGREADLQLLSLSDLSSTYSYNPFTGDTANQIRDKIMSAFEWSEEFYKSQSASFLLKLLIGLKRLQVTSQIQCTPALVRGCTTHGDKISEYIRKLAKEEIQARQCLEEAYQLMSSNDGYKSLQGMRTQVESLVLSDFGKLITGESKNQIDIFKAATENKITMIFLDSRRYPTTARTIGKFLIQDLDQPGVLLPLTLLTILSQSA